MRDCTNCTSIYLVGTRVKFNIVFLFVNRLRLFRDVVDVSVPNPADRGTEQDAVRQRGGKSHVLLQAAGLTQPSHTISR